MTATDPLAEVERRIEVAIYRRPQTCFRSEAEGHAYVGHGKGLDHALRIVREVRAATTETPPGPTCGHTPELCGCPEHRPPPSDVECLPGDSLPCGCVLGDQEGPSRPCAAHRAEAIASLSETPPACERPGCDYPECALYDDRCGSRLVASIRPTPSAAPDTGEREALAEMLAEHNWTVEINDMVDPYLWDLCGWRSDEATTAHWASGEHARLAQLHAADAVLAAGFRRAGKGETTVEWQAVTAGNRLDRRAEPMDEADARFMVRINRGLVVVRRERTTRVTDWQEVPADE